MIMQIYRSFLFTQKNIALIVLLLLAAPITIPASISYEAKALQQTFEITADYIHPPLANYIDAPLLREMGFDQVLGIYGNILYPQDKEQSPLRAHR